MGYISLSLLRTSKLSGVPSWLSQATTARFHGCAVEDGANGGALGGNLAPDARAFLLSAWVQGLLFREVAIGLNGIYRGMTARTSAFTQDFLNRFCVVS